jgi:Fic family protein
VVLEGITVGGKTLREHFEATNHRDAILYVEDIVSKREELTEWQMKNIHSLVLKGVSTMARLADIAVKMWRSRVPARHRQAFCICRRKWRC